MRYSIVVTLLIVKLHLALAASLVSIEHAAVSVPSDADFSNGFPSSPPTPSPLTPSPSSSDPITTPPGLSEQVGSATPPDIVNATSSTAGSGSRSGSQEYIDTRTADAGVAANWTNQTTVDWRAKNLVYSPKLAELYFNRSQPATSTTRPPRNSNLEGLDKLLSVMKPSTRNKTSDTMTFPPPPPDILRGFKTRGDSFYDRSRAGSSSKKEDSGASAMDYRWIQIATSLVIVQWALV